MVTPNLTIDFDKYKTKADDLYEDVKRKSADNWTAFKDKVNDIYACDSSIAVIPSCRWSV